jgi:hypothetical protein
VNRWPCFANLDGFPLLASACSWPVVPEARSFVGEIRKRQIRQTEARPDLTEVPTSV